ncbi:mechanosensitive ion channel family protein [Planktothrix serta]|nr:mechanosensitive ion channel family protein [Planktothrix serta]
MSRTFVLRLRHFHQLILALTIALFAVSLNASIPQTLAGEALPSDINPVTSVIRVGNMISAPVQIDGEELFRVASNIPLEIDKKGDNISIKQRAKLIENELDAILNNQLYGGLFAKGFEPNTLTLTVKKEKENFVIFASDQDELRERAIMTVTPIDAEFNGYSLDIWAKKLTILIKKALLKGYEQRQPAYLYQASLWVLGVILLSSLLSFGVYLLQKRLSQQKLILTQQKPEFNLAENSPHSDPTDLNNQVQIHEATEQQKRWDKKLSKNQYQRLVLKLVQLLIWVLAVWKMTQFFPQTRLFSIWLSHDPFFLLIIFLFVMFAIRISTLTIDAFLQSIQDHYNLNPMELNRQELRFVTYSVVLKGVSKVIWIILGLIVALDSLEIPIAPVVAGVGIIGIALSFGSQNLIRDVLNGIFILLEDQYAVGDYITVGETSGYVEYMNLRITQVRGKEGRLTTLTNGSINIVHNQTKEWARIDFKTTITYQSNVDLALDVMKKVIEQMSQEPDWKKSILTPVMSSGVSDLLDTGVELEIRIKTSPGAQWKIACEYRRRLKLAFDQQGIKFGKFEQTVFLPEVSQLLSRQIINH